MNDQYEDMIGFIQEKIQKLTAVNNIIIDGLESIERIIEKNSIDIDNLDTVTNNEINKIDRLLSHLKEFRSFSDSVLKSYNDKFNSFIISNPRFQIRKLEYYKDEIDKLFIKESEIIANEQIYLNKCKDVLDHEIQEVLSIYKDSVYSEKKDWKKLFHDSLDIIKNNNQVLKDHAEKVKSYFQYLNALLIKKMSIFMDKYNELKPAIVKITFDANNCVTIVDANFFRGVFEKAKRSNITFIDSVVNKKLLVIPAYVEKEVKSGVNNYNSSLVPKELFNSFVKDMGAVVDISKTSISQTSYNTIQNIYLSNSKKGEWDSFSEGADIDIWYYVLYVKKADNFIIISADSDIKALQNITNGRVIVVDPATTFGLVA